MKKQNSKTLIEFLSEHAAADAVSFHMPGHKGARFFEKLGYGELIKNLVDHDVTEIYGADNLFRPVDVILNLMERYAALYEVKKSFLSVGGSSSGIIASILSVLEAGDSVLIARNCHKSIYNGVSLAGGAPIYVYPEIISDLDIAGEISVESVEEALSTTNSSNNDLNAAGPIKAVIVPSPNYYGIISDIKAIAKVCHERGAILIVDQAHGAHLNFMTKSDELAAERCGADIVINSTHKTLGSFTQTAIVNVCSDRVDADLLGEKLEIIQSSSPSYILMESLGINLNILESSGRELFRGWEEDLHYFRGESKKIPGLSVYSHKNLDPTKLLLDMRALGISGNQLEELLREYDIYLELSDKNFALAMTGIGNERSDYVRLLEALDDIAVRHSNHTLGDKSLRGNTTYDESTNDLAHSSEASGTMKDEKEYALSEILSIKRERREVRRPFEKVKPEDGIGRTIASSVIPYPPGIPVLVPGDVLDETTAKWLADQIARGEKVLGIDTLGNLMVTN